MVFVVEVAVFFSTDVFEEVLLVVAVVGAYEAFVLEVTTGFSAVELVDSPFSLAVALEESVGEAESALGLGSYVVVDDGTIDLGSSSVVDVEIEGLSVLSGLSAVEFSVEVSEAAALISAGSFLSTMTILRTQFLPFQKLPAGQLRHYDPTLKKPSEQVSSLA